MGWNVTCSSNLRRLPGRSVNNIVEHIFAVLLIPGVRKLLQCIHCPVPAIDIWLH